MKVMEFGRVMMNTLFGPIPEITSDELDEYRNEHALETYTLLDVRQPREYEEDHLPGAKLVPLPDLSRRIDEIDKSKPVIAYCAIGGRSRAAAEFLAGRGFDKVYSLKGGINAWEGIGAEGPEQSGMALFDGQETPAKVLAVAYGLESGLGDFYKQMAGALDKRETSDLLLKLAHVEDAHKDKVMRMFEETGPTDQDRELLAEMQKSGIVEGGYTLEVLMVEHGQSSPSNENVLDIAMTIESQAMDLYMRLSDSLKDQAAKDAMLELSNDELAHLSSLGKLRDE
jgi:rhodanese-related sulfurtransferase/rubrerythrin